MTIAANPRAIAIEVAKQSCLACSNFAIAPGTALSYCKAGRKVYVDSGKCDRWRNYHQPNHCCQQTTGGV